jgi:hypothetical protein
LRKKYFVDIHTASPYRYENVSVFRRRRRSINASLKNF